MYKAKIQVQGIVQGVGFRPSVYRIAQTLNLNGYVKNLGNIVEIILEGKKSIIEEFILELQTNKPPLATISSLKIEWLDYNNEYSDFSILKSFQNFSGNSIIPPDVTICDDCLNDINNSENRHYNYPFTTCSNCGPRFTVINSTPYDRERTSMNKFPLCPDCNKEYNDPNNRRYHAESICCPRCGPELLFSDDSEIKTEDPIKFAVNLLDGGNILAIKGIGGTHLVCRADKEESISTLRERLNRPTQPFACMCSDINTIEKFAELSKIEKLSLNSQERPIVLVDKSEYYDFPDILAPNLHNIGVMLPYSGIHYLLFKNSNVSTYVMTSANIPGTPMLINNNEIRNKLVNIADYFLIHDRKISNRCDDSIIRFQSDKKLFIRRSRGYVPKPYDLSNLSNNLTVLSLGPELDVTVSLLKEGKCYISQYVGNTSKYETYEYLQDVINHMINLLQINNIDVIACDLHPQFLTTKLARELSNKYNTNFLQVQHHYAHAKSLAVDINIDEMIVIAADGVGYGSDGTIWGGEIFYINDSDYNRLASLIPQKMPGGDPSTKYPARMLISMLYNYYPSNELHDLMIEKYIDSFPGKNKEIDTIFKQLEKNINVPITTSTGRVLDTISVALNICSKRTYEGESSLKLESFAYKGKNYLDIPIVFKKINNLETLDTSIILKNIIELINEGESRFDIALSAQKSVAEGLAELSLRSADQMGIKVIGGTGGVFYNKSISLIIKNYLEKEGYKFIQHKNSCPGDGSVSLGQAAVAASKFS